MLTINGFLVNTKEFSIEGSVVPGLLLYSNLEQSKSPGTIVHSLALAIFFSFSLDFFLLVWEKIE